MTSDEVFEIIKAHITQLIPALKSHEFSRSDQLKELGANSMDRSDIIEQTMSSLALEIPRVEVFGTRNLGELADLLYNKKMNVGK